jgi:hypothetical protein
VIVGIECGAKFVVGKVGLEAVVKEFEDVETAAAAGAEAVGRDAKEASLGLIIEVVDGW